MEQLQKTNGCGEAISVARRSPAGKARRDGDFPGRMFFEPTILHQVQHANPIMRQEVFGPVLSVVPFKEEDEVVQLATIPNLIGSRCMDVGYSAAHRIARVMHPARVDQHVPPPRVQLAVCGYKNSVWAPQNGSEAIYQYLRTKSVWCELSSEYKDTFSTSDGFLSCHRAQSKRQVSTRSTLWLAKIQKRYEIDFSRA